MKVKEIEEILKYIKSSGMQEVNIETSEFKISVKKNITSTVIPSSNVVPISSETSLTTEITDSLSEKSPLSLPKEDKENQEASNHYIELKSPMIGTFYRAPNAEAKPFVNIGDKIKIGKTICIIEAMKIFNEIEAESSGEIVKILVEDATPIEYGQPLFLIDPS